MSLAIRTDEHNLISGSVDRIYCKIESGALPFAARSLVVLREGYVTIADLRIPQSSGTFTAKLGVSIIALSGELDLRKQQDDRSLTQNGTFLNLGPQTETYTSQFDVNLSLQTAQSCNGFLSM